MKEKNSYINLAFKRLTLILLVLFALVINGVAQDTHYIKVHFLYGSKPLREYKKTEPRWFGGILGGHAGIESSQHRILNFIPDGRFHIIANNKTKHGRYTTDSLHQFYSRLGGQHPDSAKKAIIIIPLSYQQKLKFDSIAATYLTSTPYDYAFIGMRCGAATYEILAKLGIVKALPLAATIAKVPYPKKLRKELLKKAEKNGWTVITEPGTKRRKWEDD